MQDEYPPESPIKFSPCRRCPICRMGYYIIDEKWLFTPNYFSNKGILFYLFFYQSPQKIEDYACNGYKYLYRLFRDKIMR